MDRETLELGENEREVKAEEFTHWMNLDTTSEFRRRLLNLFDPHVALLSVELGQSADRLIGRAEVLDYVLHPHRLFED
jgi:hypothetical protein